MTVKNRRGKFRRLCQHGISTGKSRRNYQLATGVLHSIIDSSCKIQYSHVISEKTIEQDIIVFAHLDSQSIIAYFLPLLEKCHTPEKLLVALYEDSNVAKSIVGLGLKEWSQISALLYLGKADTALQLYDNLTPIAWFGRQVLSDAQKNMCRWRIATLGVGKVPDDYRLFGRQGNGKVIPVPEQFEKLKYLYLFIVKNYEISVFCFHSKSIRTSQWSR